MTALSNLSIIYLDPAQLTPHPKNPRKHSRKQQKLLASNVDAHGFINPIVIDEANTILAGHCRQAVALKANLSSVPCIRVSHLMDAQKLAYVLADNKMSDLGQWDADLLKLNIEELLTVDYNVELTGFSTAEIDRRLGSLGTTPEEVTLKSSYQPVCQIGDIWQLDEHRIHCGNALEAASYTALMSGAAPQMVFTDPPYNVPIAGHVKKDAVDAREFPMATGEMSQSEFTSFLRQFLTEAAAVCSPGAVIYTCMDHKHLVELRQAASGMLDYLQLCVWAKDRAGMGSFYRSQHELVAVFKKPGAEHINNFGLGAGGRYRSNVWQYPMIISDKDEYSELPDHPTPKPLSLVADAIRDCSKRNGIILDPFLGSGTTLLAADMTGRKCYGLELDPAYIDLTVLRWQEKTGKAATLVSSGQTFAERQHSLQVAEVSHG